MSEQTMLAIKNYARSDEIIERFAEVVGQHNAPAYISSVLLAVANSQSLQECSPQSIIVSAMRAATLRLSCDPSTGQAYIVPFKGKATLIVGYKGIKDMAIRTNKYRFINVAKIREGQTVEEDQLTGVHKIVGFRNTNAPIIGYLLYFELRNGYSKSFYMSVDEILEHARKFSKTFGRADSTWTTNPEAMMEKTVLRLGLTRYGYLDPNDVMVMNAVDEEENIVDGEVLPDEEEVTAKRDVNQSTGEILDDLGFTPEPEPEPTPQPAQTNGAKLTRPLLPSQLQDSLKKKAEGKGNKPASKEQRSLAAMLLNQIFQDEAHRHTFQLYACGSASLADVSDGMILALLDWLEPKKDSGGMYYANADSEKEARMAYTEALKVEGQAELFEGV